MNNPKISIVIPVLNEGATIDHFLNHIITQTSSQNHIKEIIVVDGGSTDNSLEKIKKFPGVILLSAKKGRARQMNKGARYASGELLYFLHADSYPPKRFDQFIIDTFRKGSNAGCFRMKFDDKHPVLKFSQWFTRFNLRGCRGGDQSLFVEQNLFHEIGGYDESYIICEDYNLISKLYKRGHFEVIPQYITTSSRRYRENGTWRLQYHFTVIHLKNFFGATPEELHNYYKRKVAS